MATPNEVLIPAATFESLANSIRLHLVTCDRDHSQMFHQAPIIDFNPALSTLTCKLCKCSERLNKPPADGTQIDTYIHHLLIQQQRFFDTHFASCVEAKGGVS